MQVTSFIRQLNIRAILNSLFLMLQLFGLLTLVPLMVSVFAGEYAYSWLFAAMAAVTFLTGRIFALKHVPDLSTNEALVVTAFVYLLFGLLGACAFLPASSYLNGFFEAMSGFTTTGLSVMNVQDLPKSLLFFRAYTQWIGGAGIVVVSLVLLLGPGKSAFQLYDIEFREENIIGDVKATSRLVFKVYALLTISGYLAFLLAGMGFFDSLLHVMSTLSTGGFSAYNDSIGHYRSPSIEIAVAVFMILGAIGFPSYHLLGHKGFRRFLGDLQFRCLAVFVLVFTALFFMEWGWDSRLLLPSLFHATTAITTTGFQTVNWEAWPEGMKLLSAFLMVIGGAAGSTAGGVKLFRLLVMVQLVKWFVLRALLPEEAILSIKYGDSVVSDLQIKQMFAFVVLYLLFISLSSAALVFAGFDVMDSFFESASAIGTVGLSSGITSAGLAAWAKLLLVFDMWAGRLEILPVLAILYPGIWKQNRRNR